MTKNRKGNLNLNIEYMEILSKLHIWQFALVMSVILLYLGFTGDIPFTDDDLRDGKGTLAIIVGVGFFIAACALRYIPPPTIAPLKEEEEELDDDV